MHYLQAIRQRATTIELQKQGKTGTPQVIGAVGVSGGVGEQDAIIADAAAAALADNRAPSG